MQNIPFRLGWLVLPLVLLQLFFSEPQTSTLSVRVTRPTSVLHKNSSLSRADSTTKTWYKNSVIYTLDVEVFYDSDGDGIGDFRGLTQKLDYLKSLDIDAIWLAPFQPTPNKDDGYDISDFYGIDKRFGTFNDFSEFISEAKKRDIRILMDLVINHTSDEYSWFKASRKSKDSPYRDWYVWKSKQPANQNKGMVFPGVQKEIWTLDSLTNEYYLHRFYDFEPDLNAQNPEVVAEIEKIIKYWLKKGVAGFRLDAVPFYIEVPQTKGENFEHEYDKLVQMRNWVKEVRPDGVILGEANIEPKENMNYFGDKGQAMNMMFNFYVNQHLFYALASGEIKSLTKALEATKDIPQPVQWAQFLRNHDEVDLARLSNNQREKVYKEFGPDKNMQLYDRGIRRRIAPMLHNQKRLALAYSLLFSLPSTPVIRYGEEIGMGDDLTLKERESVRTPMQWINAPNAGFSTASKTVRPVISQGEYGYSHVNVKSQEKDPSSMLNWVRQLIHLRKSNPHIGQGDWKILASGSPNVLVMQYEWNGSGLVLIHNLDEETQKVELKAKDAGGDMLFDLISKKKNEANEKGLYQLTMPGYGYAWYRIGNESVLPNKQD
ncbi:alpha-amylase family glycosyl hydrolase [Cytophagaceae bacterium DM2B3-1]|uniref:Alpha-amylase family glycosyl hydrolase n=1 Tax=Xanthocytophaga flava TaxID=3048013 RepID=A0ABT7CMB1_9BACT|nr:alpha-amylase family glycosyl hydrolase [Xanthocytophaga flavus]MDJ1494884.1 alpha-amylase family glycosyl hydrolase [Xanthocytophaga flavus]